MRRSETNPKTVFLFCCPRSGSGILHNTLKFHPQISYTTPVTQALHRFTPNSKINRRMLLTLGNPLDRLLAMFPTDSLPERVRRIKDGFFEGDRLPTAVEEYWGLTANKPHAYVTEDDLSDDRVEYIKDYVNFHREYFHSPVFLGKKPYYSLAIKALNSIFPNALFIHLIRDGRAVANSLLNMRSDKHSWWGARPPRAEEKMSEPPIVQCAWQWKRILEIVERDRQLVDSSRYTAVRYADFIENPESVLEELCDFMGLDYSGIESHLSKVKDQLENRNYKWKQQLSHRQKYLLHEELAGDGR